MSNPMDFLSILASSYAFLANDIGKVEYVAGKTEKFILKVPTKLTNIFRRKYNKHNMEIVSEPKKNNIFYYYIKIELEENNQYYLDGFDYEGNATENYYFYFVYSGKDTVMCFRVHKDIPRTEDGYIKGIVSSPVMEQFIKIRDNLSKKEENKWTKKILWSR